MVRSVIRLVVLLNVLLSDYATFNSANDSHDQGQSHASHSHDVFTTVGKNVTLSCDNNTPIIVTSWILPNGRVIQQGDGAAETDDVIRGFPRFRVFQNSSSRDAYLTVSFVKTTDQGVYTCAGLHGNNDHNMDTRDINSVHLNVLAPPPRPNQCHVLYVTSSREILCSSDSTYSDDVIYQLKLKDGQRETLLMDSTTPEFPLDHVIKNSAVDWTKQQGKHITLIVCAVRRNLPEAKTCSSPLKVKLYDTDKDGGSYGLPVILSVVLVTLTFGVILTVAGICYYRHRLRLHVPSKQDESFADPYQIMAPPQLHEVDPLRSSKGQGLLRDTSQRVRQVRAESPTAKVEVTARKLSASIESSPTIARHAESDFRQSSDKASGKARIPPTNGRDGRDRISSLSDSDSVVAKFNTCTHYTATRALGNSDRDRSKIDSKPNTANSRQHESTNNNIGCRVDGGNSDAPIKEEKFAFAKSNDPMIVRGSSFYKLFKPSNLSIHERRSIDYLEEPTHTTLQYGSIGKRRSKRHGIDGGGTGDFPPYVNIDTFGNNQMAGAKGANEFPPYANLGSSDVASRGQGYQTLKYTKPQKESHGCVTPTRMASNNEPDNNTCSSRHQSHLNAGLRRAPIGSMLPHVMNDVTDDGTSNTCSRSSGQTYSKDGRSSQITLEMYKDRNEDLDNSDSKGYTIMKYPTRSEISRRDKEKTLANHSSRSTNEMRNRDRSISASTSSAFATSSERRNKSIVGSSDRRVATSSVQSISPGYSKVHESSVPVDSTGYKKIDAQRIINLDSDERHNKQRGKSKQPTRFERIGKDCSYEGVPESSVRSQHNHRSRRSSSPHFHADPKASTLHEKRGSRGNLREDDWREVATPKLSKSLSHLDVGNTKSWFPDTSKCQMHSSVDFSHQSLTAAPNPPEIPPKLSKKTRVYNPFFIDSHEVRAPRRQRERGYQGDNIYHVPRNLPCDEMNVGEEGLPSPSGGHDLMSPGQDRWIPKKKYSRRKSREQSKADSQLGESLVDRSSTKSYPIRKDERKPSVNNSSWGATPKPEISLSQKEVRNEFSTEIILSKKDEYPYSEARRFNQGQIVLPLRTTSFNSSDSAISESDVSDTRRAYSSHSDTIEFGDNLKTHSYDTERRSPHSPKLKYDTQRSKTLCKDQYLGGTRVVAGTISPRRRDENSHESNVVEDNEKSAPALTNSNGGDINARAMQATNYDEDTYYRSGRPVYIQMSRRHRRPRSHSRSRSSLNSVSSDRSSVSSSSNTRSSVSSFGESMQAPQPSATSFHGRLPVSEDIHTDCSKVRSRNPISSAMSEPSSYIGMTRAMELEGLEQSFRFAPKRSSDVVPMIDPSDRVIPNGSTGTKMATDMSTGCRSRTQSNDELQTRPYGGPSTMTLTSGVRRSRSVSSLHKGSNHGAKQQHVTVRRGGHCDRDRGDTPVDDGRSGVFPRYWRHGELLRPLSNSQTNVWDTSRRYMF